MSAPPTNESDSEVPQDCDEGDESTIDSSLSSPADNSTSSATATIAIGVPEPQPSGSKDNSGVKGKRKRSREDRVEAVMASVVKEVMNAQKESDKLFLEVEEKRMKFVAEMKREEREFQLRCYLSCLVAKVVALLHPISPLHLSLTNMGHINLSQHHHTHHFTKDSRRKTY